MVHCSFMQTVLLFFLLLITNLSLHQTLDFLNPFDSLMHFNLFLSVYFKYVVQDANFYRTEYSKIHLYPHQTLLVVS